MLEEKRILLICDDELVTRHLREKLIIDGGYFVAAEPSSQKGLAALKNNSFDMVIAKFGLSDAEPQVFFAEIKRINPECIIIAFIETPDSDVLRQIARLGIYDFIAKPINLEKLFFLIKKGIELKVATGANHKLIQGLQEQNSALQKQNTLLAKRIEQSTQNLTRLYEDLRSTYMRTIKVLAQAIDARDHYTHSHSENVAKIAVAIAAQMNLVAKDIEMVREACELHDLGKIGVEDSILSKPSELTEQEWEQIKRHPVTGAQILEPLTFLNGVIDIVRQHHEHYDGTGYPEGRKGEDILLGARIIHLADAYESMTSTRSYRKIPFSKQEAVLEIKRNNGTQFDPKVTEAFLKIVDKL